jgi:phage tail-like protein
MTTAGNPYPYTSFRFRIEIGGITISLVSDVTGLQMETEIESYEEGGVNDFVYQFPKRTKYQHISLKRGITDKGDLWEWYQDVINGKFQRKDGAIVLMDIKGEDKWRWNFFGAYPIKWTGPELKAESSTVAFETLELAHNGIRKS